MAKTVLIAGASGLVGFAALRHFAEVMLRKWFRLFQNKRLLRPVLDDSPPAIV